MTTTSHASYTEEIPLVTPRELFFSAFFVIAGGMIAWFADIVLFLILLPLSLFLLIFREWKLFKGMADLRRAGIIKFEPKYKTNKREANRNLLVILALIVTPMILSYLLQPLPWLSLTMGFVMAWPASNILEGFLQAWFERKTGKRLRRFYRWEVYGEEVLMKEYGWSLN